MKVILNKCYGGFNVSNECYRLYAKKKGIELFAYQSEAQRDGWRYVRVPKGKEDNSLCVYYFKKDYGESVSEKLISLENHIYLDEGHREDPVLIECVEELGTKRASGRYGKLVVVEIPDGMNYVIDEYDGIETLHADVPCW